MTKIQKVLFSGKTHTVFNHGDGTSRKRDERVDMTLTTPNDRNSLYAYAAVQSHPTAEQLFAGAWSACYISALSVVAKQKKVELPPGLAVDVEVDVGVAGAEYLLQARFNVTLPGMPQEEAEALAHEADQICPYSKATRGNIDVSLTVVGEREAAVQ